MISREKRPPNNLMPISIIRQKLNAAQPSGNILSSNAQMEVNTPTRSVEIFGDHTRLNPELNTHYSVPEEDGIDDLFASSAHPNTQDAPATSAIHLSTALKAPNILDLDYPDTSQDQYDNMSLNYDDHPPPDEDPHQGPMAEALSQSVISAAQRAQEAESLFSSIAATIDLQCSSPHISRLSPRKKQAFRAFCEDLVSVAKSHFEAYTRGEPAKSAYSPNNSTCHTSSETPQSFTYANVAAHGGLSSSAHATSQRKTFGTPANHKSSNKPSEAQSDDRLFLRLPEGDKLRSLSPFAILTHLKASLGANSHLLINVQSTKSGLALCPKKGESSALKEKISTIELIRDVTIENATPWTSYRIQNVPRNYGTINDEFEHQLFPVTTTSLSEALYAAIGIKPVAITPSQDNDIHPDTSSTS